MRFSAKIEQTFPVSPSTLWVWLTEPERIRQYFFGTNLVTSWQPGTTIFWRGEWEGKAYEDKGTVLKFEPEKMLEYDYFSSWSEAEDIPENYQIIRYELEAQGDHTLLTITQSNIPTEEQKDHSVQNWKGLMEEMNRLLSE
ncbi:MAG TPA: SRPBCC family protein [Saprospiraceae bacterium]|nr:SRPBCC family protein [Saprospiraceae bacterium]HMQ82244.1 SRPBCC family protein [Saprospiraceae bacterium]